MERYTNINQQLECLRIAVAEKDPNAIHSMQSHKTNPKLIRSKSAVAAVTNQLSAKSKQLGGATRARLRAKLNK